MKRIKPFAVYHSATTGKDDCALKGFIEAAQGKGIVPFTGKRVNSNIEMDDDGSIENGKLVQNNGFFCEISDGFSKTDAIGAAREGKPGKPLRVTVACNLGSGWQFDYEDGWKVKPLIFGFIDDLKNARPDAIEIAGQCVQSVHEEKTPVDGLRIKLRSKKDQSEAEYFLRRNRTSYMETPDYYEQVFSEASVLEALRNYLVSIKGDGFLHAEQEAILDQVKEQNQKKYPGVLALKYTGKKPLPVKAIEVFENRQWSQVNIPKVQKPRGKAEES